MKKLVNTELVIEISKGLKNSNGFSKQIKKAKHGILVTNIKIFSEIKALFTLKKIHGIQIFLIKKITLLDSYLHYPQF